MRLTCPVAVGFMEVSLVWKFTLTAQLSGD
jgi:hypothetical protein